ncbi:MAG TPA: hypothetical protein VFH30_09005 [Acidimicrobiales bacterium]|nr:hypothetical protein [Acidimicrobiales bacterium]
MHAKTRGNQRPKVSGMTGPRAGRRAAVAAGGLALVAGACAGSSNASPDAADPTFERAAGSSIAYEEPVADVADLLAPAAEGQPWLILGSVFDPESGTTVASTWSADDGRSWDRSDVEPAHKGVSEVMTAGQSDADGNLLAVGWVGNEPESDAAIWRYQAAGDDEGWTLSTPEALGGDHEQWAFDVASNETGTLVAGGENAWGEVRPRLWFSDDGKAWHSVDDGAGGPFDAAGDESIRDIAAVANGFVAVGSATGDGQDGAAWFSPDGTTWSRVEAPSLGGRGRQAVESVVWTGEVVVAGGYTTDANGQGQPVIWRSTDGAKWSNRSAPLALDRDGRTAAADYSVTGLSYDGAGITASGGNNWRPHTWWSTDGGQSWRLLPNPVHAGLFGDGVALVDSAGAGKVRVAIGSEPSVLYIDSANRWQDASGEAFPNGGAQPFATSLAVGSKATVAAGYRHSAPKGATRETFGGQIWLDRGAGGWEAIDSKQLAAGQLTDVVPYKGGFVAVGTEDFGVAAGRQFLGDSQPDGLVWTSPDGRKWTRLGVQVSEVSQEDLEVIENPDASQAPVIAGILASQPPETVKPAGGPGVRSLDATAPLGDGFIAVGVAYVSGDADPIVVTSPDGKKLAGEDAGAGGAGTQRFRDVCVANGTAIAVGSSGAAEGSDVLVRYRAKDGKWSKVTDDGSFGGGGNQQAYGCAASEDGFIVVGSDDRSGDADARVWVSEDGLEWTRVESGMLGGGGDQWASAAAAVPGDGWLIGGTDTAAGDGDVALWRLPGDGDISRRDRGEPELGGTGRQSVTSIVVDDDRVLIAGNDYGRVGIWESDTIDR